MAPMEPLAYQARDFAHLAGVTVRTLHHYDRLGLLKPGTRTKSGYRLYGQRDLERLERIVALKFFGLSLKQIRTLLDGEANNLMDALQVQRRLLESKRDMLGRAVEAICQAESQIRSTGNVSAAAIRRIIEVMKMNETEDLMEKYATEAGKAKMKERMDLWSPELQERVSRQWNELIAEVENALGDDPATVKSQALASRWNDLVNEFTGRDKDIEQSVGNMWANREKWSGEINQRAPVIKPEVWQFIAQANQSRPK